MIAIPESLFQHFAIPDVPNYCLTFHPISLATVQVRGFSCPHGQVYSLPLLQPFTRFKDLPMFPDLNKQFPSPFSASPQLLSLHPFCLVDLCLLWTEMPKRVVLAEIFAAPCFVQQVQLLLYLQSKRKYMKNMQYLGRWSFHSLLPPKSKPPLWHR